MVSINTNLSSLIVQNNLTKSTNALNTAIERMTTGFKLNNASDNAANYSISTDMSSKISSLNIAEENASMGLDMVMTASSTLETMSDLMTRLRNLTEQAQNGTYGTQSIEALTTEAESLITEVNRIISGTEYNGINVFENGLVCPTAPREQTQILRAKESGFVEDIELVDTSQIKSFGEYYGTREFGEDSVYKISTAEELELFLNELQDGESGDVSIVLDADIDMSEAYINPRADRYYRNTFNGNGHTISNLHLKGQPENGLFTRLEGCVTNLGLINCNVEDGGFCGAIAGAAEGSSIINCYTQGGYVKGTYAGQLVGALAGGHIISSYGANERISEIVPIPELRGLAFDIAGDSSIQNCYTTSDYGWEFDEPLPFPCEITKLSIIEDDNPLPASLAKSSDGKFMKAIERVDTSGLASVSTITSATNFGTYKISTAEDLAYLSEIVNAGLVGEDVEFVLANDIDLNTYLQSHTWTPIGVGENFAFVSKFNGNGYTISNLKIDNDGTTQGLFGSLLGNAEVSNLGVVDCDISGDIDIGGLAGEIIFSSNVTISNCFVTGDIEATSYNSGGLVGTIYDGSFVNISDCYTSANVSAYDQAGGLVGEVSRFDNFSVSNCYVSSEITVAHIISGKAFGCLGSRGANIDLSYDSSVSKGLDIIGKNPERIYPVINQVITPKADISNTQQMIKSLSELDERAPIIGGTYTISSAEELAKLERLSNESEVRYAKFILTNDIDLSDYDEWDGIGLWDSVFDGQGHNITGFNVNGTDGLFRYALDSEIKNVNLVDCNVVNERGSAGGLVFESYHSTIRNCSVTGSVCGKRAGLLACDISDGEVIGCSVSGTVKADSEGGGIAASISESEVSYSSSAANISSLSEDATPNLGVFASIVGDYSVISNCVYDSTQGLDGVGASRDSDIEGLVGGELVKPIVLQVGITSDTSSQLEFDASFSLRNLDYILSNGIQNAGNFDIIDGIIGSINKIQTSLGAVENRLLSVIDSISVKRDNLVSSRSTLRDADIAKVSSDYIRQQILQQASATLLATANQSPALVLQLIQGF